MKPEIGQQLRQAREARELTLEQVAQATRMRLRYLQAMEAGDLEALPSTAQARGFLRTYAGFLKLDADALLSALDNKSPGRADQPAQPTQPPAGPAARPQDEPDSQEAAAIFVNIGHQLQQRREMLGLSLDEVARHTRLRLHYLVALEAGNLEGLPSPVQGRGMLKNYAAFLGLDPDPLLLRFADGLQARLAAKRPVKTEPRPANPPPEKEGRGLLRRLISGDLLIGTLIVVALAGFILWGAIRIFATLTTQSAAATPPPIAAVLLTPATEPATPTRPGPTSTRPAPAAVAEPGSSQAGSDVEPAPEVVLPALPSGVPNGVQIYVTVKQRTFMRALVDGKLEFEGRVLPGSAYTFSGTERVEILTGNGAALQIFFNQQDLGPMGVYGQIVDRIFTAIGIQTPTATASPTATATPRNMPTAKPAGTSEPGRTPAAPALP